MNQRQKQLLKYLIDEEDYVTVKQLAKLIGVSERTIHHDLDDIAALLPETSGILQKKTHKGIRLDASPTQRHLLLNSFNTNKKQVDLLSTRIRRMKIYAYLLMHIEGTSINKLSDAFLVSNSSIVSDLSLVEKRAKEDQLSLVRDNKGTRIEGPEETIRHALSNLANEFVTLEYEEEEQDIPKTRLDLSTFYRLTNIFNIEHMERIENIIAKAEEKLGYKVNEISYVNLVTHLLILIKRMKNDSILSNDDAKKTYEAEGDEKIEVIAHFIACEISRAFDVDIPFSEEKYIYQYLVCSGIQNDFFHQELSHYPIHIDQHIHMIVESLIHFVSDTLHYDLLQDKELYLSLCAHIVPMMQRHKYHISLDNPLLKEIKTQYAAMFSIVTLAVEEISDFKNQVISEDEIGYLTIHFQAAIERSMQEKRVIIVCPEGIGFSRLIAHRLERFVSSIDIVEIVTLKKLETYDLSFIDFVISTVPIKDCPKPVLIVTSFISTEDISCINNYLVESCKTSPSHSLDALTQILDPQVIMTHLSCQNKEEVLHLMTDQLCKTGHVTPDYEKSVLEREKIMSTDLGNLIAIPHGHEQDIIQPTIAIATLDHKILWDKNEVQIIFVIALNMNHPQITKTVLKDLYTVLDSNYLIQKMIEAPQTEDLIHLITAK